MENSSTVLTEINERLESIREKNPLYSMRAFSKKVGISHAYLNQILNNKRRLTRKTAEKILKALDYSDSDINLFLSQVKSSKGKRAQDEGERSKSAYHQYNVEEDRQFESYEIFLIFHLVTTKGFREDLDWISKRLDMPIETVKRYLDILLSFGILKRNAVGNLYQAHAEDILFPNHVDSDSISRKNVEQMNKIARFEKKTNMIIPPNMRESSISMIAVDTKKIPVALSLIDVFHHDITKCLESGPDRDEIYYFSVILQPASFKVEEEEIKKLQ